jgi:hypothetical protein
MRVIGLDVHRSMAVVAVLEKERLTNGGRIDLTRDAVIAFGRKLRPDDEVVIEATVNTAAIVHLLRPFVRRVLIANPFAGPSNRARQDQDRQDRRCGAGKVARQWLSARGLDARRDD